MSELRAFPRHVGVGVREKPLLVYDDDCTFCKRWVARWRQMTGDALDYEPFQAIAEEFPAIPRVAFEEAVKFIEPNGRVSSGAEAVFRSLTYGRGRGLGWWLYRHAPGFAPASEIGYRFVADHRMLFSRLTTLVLGEAFPEPRRPAWPRWLALAGLVLLGAVCARWLRAPRRRP